MNESYQQILHLMNEYCYRIDAGDLDGFADLFANGEWHVLGNPAGADRGREAVLATLQNVILYDGRPNTKHVMTNIDIAIDEPAGKASAQCYITLFQSVPPEFPLQAIFSGHYQDLFVRAGQEWRFASRVISPDLAGDLRFHRADMAGD